MPSDLKRYQRTGDLHFITFSCYQRRPYLRSAEARHLFECSLETMRIRYDFTILGYVVMPEHIHLLVSEPKQAPLSKALQALKLSVTAQRQERPFWQKRYYDFNVFTKEKIIEKLRYMHRNPILRGLAKTPEAWPWSSFLHWKTGAIGAVTIEPVWTMEQETATVECLSALTMLPRAVSSSRNHFLCKACQRPRGEAVPKTIAIHPGEVLKEEFLVPLGITPYRLAQVLHVPAPRANDVVLGKRGISADTALRLGRYLNTSGQFWSNLQAQYKLRVVGQYSEVRED